MFPFLEIMFSCFKIFSFRVPFTFPCDLGLDVLGRRCGNKIKECPMHKRQTWLHQEVGMLNQDSEPGLTLFNVSQPYFNLGLVLALEFVYKYVKLGLAHFYCVFF